MAEKKEKLWTMSFLLLWQGQLVSILGDVVYAVALGFWILEVTGSTALMGALMAASTLPRVVISPIAGVFVDRVDRKKLMILMDVIRGIGVALVGAAAIFGFIEVWMVFVVGVVLGICGAFFSPATSAVIPDITAKSKIVQANSVFAMIQTGGGMVGSPIGGFFYQAFGAAFLFLFNGISYLFSAANLLFAKIPRIFHEKQRSHFFSDLGSGFSFVWRFRGLRTIMGVAAIINFFASMAIMLFLPFFRQGAGPERLPVDIGPAMYGIAVAFFTAGMFLGFGLGSAVKIPPSWRHALFNASGMSFMFLCALFPFVRAFPLACAMLAIAGFGNAVLNVFIMATMQLTVPQDMRGKVFGLMGMLTQGLTPIAFAIGGVLAEFIPVGYLISACFAIDFLAGTPLLFLPSFRRFICFDPDKDTLESVR
jgi:DHA3 family macrolide efflux protein-like MFS transporter